MEYLLSPAAMFSPGNFDLRCTGRGQQPHDTRTTSNPFGTWNDANLCWENAGAKARKTDPDGIKALQRLTRLLPWLANTATDYQDDEHEVIVLENGDEA